MKAPRIRHQRGAILIIVLWVLALLMLLLAAFSTAVRVDRQVAGDISQRVRARAGTDAVLAYLAAMQRLGGDTWKSLPGQVLILPLADEKVRFRMVPEEAYLSLTGAPEELLGQVLEALATQQSDVSLALASLLERRQPATDDEPRSELYSVAELLRLPGFDRELVERLMPLATVDSKHSGVAFGYAPEALAILLAGGDRRLLQALRDTPAAEAPGVPAQLQTQPGGYLFRVQVEIGEGATARKLEVTTAFGQGNADYQIVRRNEYNPSFSLD